MKADIIHIVCLDAPAPPDYGGAIDMFYKIKALAQTGIKIILHYFEYRKGRGVQGLEAYCLGIHRYERKSFIQSLPLKTPFIVGSRVNEQLVKRLEEDNHPILLEGIHCAGIAVQLKDPSRVVIRIHNDEARYYSQLHAAERNVLKKLYFGWESHLLQQFQESLDKNGKLAILSHTDLEIFNHRYGFQYTAFIPCFHPWTEVHAGVGKGWYALYHGNMEVSENEGAAAWLVEEVFLSSSVPLVIAGRGITERLIRKAQGRAHIRFVNNPPMDELASIIRDAHLHVLPSLNQTGVKLKLLHALYEGRHCLTNTAGVAGSGLEAAVHIADDALSFRQQAEELWVRPYEEKDAEKRKALLGAYDNRINAQKLSALW